MHQRRHLPACRQVARGRVGAGLLAVLLAAAAGEQQLDAQVTLVSQREGTVKADEGAIDKARLQLSYTRVTAPIAGHAGFKQVDLRNLAEPNDTGGIVSIAQTRPITLTFAVPAMYQELLRRRLHDHTPLPVRALERGSRQRLHKCAARPADDGRRA